MAYTARQLITRAFFLSGVVARGAQTPTGDQITDGLYLLNALLDWKQVETDLIPYYQYISFPLVAGQEFYFLPFVASIESFTFNIDVVRYPTDSVTRRNYYGSARVDNISTLPFSWNYNRALGGGNLGLYFLPQSNYTAHAMVKIFLANVTLDTDLTNVSESVPYTFVNGSNQGYDTGYIEYLRYALAEYICSEFGIQMNPESRKVYNEIRRQLMYISVPDLSMVKTSILTEMAGLNYGDVNIGKGWRPN